MSPDRAAAPSFSSIGGDVLASGRSLPPREAEDLQRFYLAARDVALRDRDGMAAAYLCRQHAELTAALVASARWRRAGTRVAASVC